MEILILIIFCLYLTLHLVFFMGLFKNLKKPAEQSGNSAKPFVSVIVAARNEEKNIGRCIESLLNLKYPDDKLELIIINDRSTDKTKDVILGYSAKYPLLKYMEAKAGKSELKGKPAALSQAIDKASGDLIFTTDADCEVNPDWVNEMVKYYDKDTGVVNSYTIINPANIYWGFQSYDWLYLLTLASGSDGLNIPLSCVGNNMSYRKEAYREVGGYEKIKFSVTEDFMLLQTIKRETKRKTKFPVDYKLLNYTLPCFDPKELYRQKKRWGRGGLDSNWLGYVMGFSGWSISAAIMLGWFLISLKFYLMLLIGKLIIDLIFTLPVIIKFRVYKLLLYLIPFEIYFTIYAFALPFILAFDRQVVWKEQKL